jgi:hypothetical protein
MTKSPRIKKLIPLFPVRFQQQQKRFDQNLRKNHLSRSNKAIHELSARNKRQRRNDHSNKPSGANNNRKSQ